MKFNSSWCVDPPLTYSQNNYLLHQRNHIKVETAESNQSYQFDWCKNVTSQFDDQHRFQEINRFKLVIGTYVVHYRICSGCNLLEYDSLTVYRHSWCETAILLFIVRVTIYSTVTICSAFTQISFKSIARSELLKKTIILTPVQCMFIYDLFISLRLWRHRFITKSILWYLK